MSKPMFFVILSKWSKKANLKFSAENTNIYTVLCIEAKIIVQLFELTNPNPISISLFGDPNKRVMHVLEKCFMILCFKGLEKE